MAKKILGTVGLPGSGKSTFGKIAAEYDSSIEVVSLGDIVRELCTEDNVGQFADQMREEYGDGVFVRKLFEEYSFDEMDVIVVDGIRSPEEITALQENIEHSCDIVYISAPQEVRRERIDVREDRKEDSIEIRDERELSWGVDEILSEEYYDLEIENTGSYEEFERTVQNLLSNLV